MNRKEIKEEAKAKIKGNIWDILWPVIVISAISSFISGLFGPKVDINYVELTDSLRTFVTFGSGTVAIISGFLSAGYIKYLLTFVRKGKFDRNVIIETIKEKWLDILIAEILVYIIVFFCTLLFVVPGIIMGIAYTFAIYLVVDKDVAGNDSLKKSFEIMKGYKWDYFVFVLSFFGWIILACLTFGILFIWLVPYMSVASTIYYEKLLEKKK